MKKIEILQYGLEPIIIYDDDNKDISKYTIELSNILKNSNVTIVETSEKNVIIRPQYVYSILVSENNESVNIKNEFQEDVIIG